jgi:hypothetical protein
VKHYVPEALSRTYDVDRLRSIIERRRQGRHTEVDEPSVNVDVIDELDGDEDE